MLGQLDAGKLILLRNKGQNRELKKGMASPQMNIWLCGGSECLAAGVSSTMYVYL